MLSEGVVNHHIAVTSHSLQLEVDGSWQAAAGTITEDGTNTPQIVQHLGSSILHKYCTQVR
jgi:hypothetical protein